MSAVMCIHTKLVAR